jgi:hypothetical protein
MAQTGIIAVFRSYPDATEDSVGVSIEALMVSAMKKIYLYQT